jgi:hypothetical protein
MLRPLTRGLGPTAVVLVLLLVAACSAGSAPKRPSATTPVPPSTPYVGYPDSIVALGHSGSTGESSDPDQAVGVETRGNSWITGTNPTVDSLYLRLLAVHPQIKDHAVSLSRGGATVSDVLGQADQAVARRPSRPLIVIQVVDNDIACPATTQDYTTFQATFESVLKTLTDGLPTARVFVVSHYGRPANDVRTLTAEQRVQEGGTGPCAFLDPQGRLVPRELDRLDRIILRYDEALRAGCGKFTACQYDDGAFRAAPSRPELTSPIDLNHFSIAGHAEAAAVAWQAMAQAEQGEPCHQGVLPCPT